MYRILTGKTLQLPEDEPDITDTEINALLQVDIGGPPPPHQDKIIKVAFNNLFLGYPTPKSRPRKSFANFNCSYRVGQQQNS